MFCAIQIQTCVFFATLARAPASCTPTPRSINVRMDNYMNRAHLMNRQERWKWIDLLSNPKPTPPTPEELAAMSKAEKKNMMRKFKRATKAWEKKQEKQDNFAKKFTSNVDDE
jgi:hypothetical protein